MTATGAAIVLQGMMPRDFGPEEWTADHWADAREKLIASIAAAGDFFRETRARMHARSAK
jgi:hypothetical protein